MVDDVGRRMLFGTLESYLGREAATKMMEMLPEVEWGDIARRTDVEAMGLALQADMSELRGELRGEMSEINGHLSLVDGRMTGFDGRLAGFGDRLTGEIAEVKADMRAMGARIALANMAGTATIAGLVLAAIKLF